MNSITFSNSITCPDCGIRTKEEMPENACAYFWQCPGCGTVVKPLPNDCCVYCSYGDIVCPPKQQENTRDGSSNTDGCC